MISPYAFELDEDRIARFPVERRDESLLMEVDPQADTIADLGPFHRIADRLRSGDLLVLNDTRVFKARLKGRRATGGRVEVLLLGEAGPRVEALVRPLTKIRIGEEILFGTGAARLLEKREAGTALLDFGALDPARLVEREGEVPLPPYLKRATIPEDERRYQTVYAVKGDSVAAPTAGLHFTEELLARLRTCGIGTARLRLDVGYGTFAPVKDGQERLHHERYWIPAETIAAIEETRRHGHRVVAVGTTVVRALETYASTGRAEDQTDIFIRPGHSFRLVDALVTNFHLPGSSLLMLVHAFAGEIIFRAYHHALGSGYRFFSYGDVMFINGPDRHSG